MEGFDKQQPGLPASMTSVPILILLIFQKIVKRAAANPGSWCSPFVLTL
jgi:hypothetical protein